MCEMVTDSSDKVTVAFPQLLSFGWLFPFAFKDFLFKHSTVIKPLEQLMEFSVKEILHIDRLIPEGPEDSLRPGCPAWL